jgi:transcriptional regulator with XRE-family HTH domain
MNMNEQNPPFVALGKHLKFVREQAQQTLSEVSGAVEIDERYLERIEAGEERPAEDILLLLMSHFGVQDQEAIQLWELANYDSEMPAQIRNENHSFQTGGKPVVMLLAIDMRTIYSDGLDIQCAPAGLTMNFTQIAGRQARPAPVARVGMSYEQAQQVLENLEKALLKVKYLRAQRSLPPKSQSDISSESNS